MAHHTTESHLRLAARYREIAADIKIRRDTDWAWRHDYFSRQADKLEHAAQNPR